jgi:hypothetical protein
MKRLTRKQKDAVRKDFSKSSPDFKAWSKTDRLAMSEALVKCIMADTNEHTNKNKNKSK